MPGQNGSQVVEQILNNPSPIAKQVKQQFERRDPSDLVFDCRHVLYEAIAPTLRDSPDWNDEAVEKAITMLDLTLQKFEQQTSSKTARSSS